MEFMMKMFLSSLKVWDKLIKVNRAKPLEEMSSFLESIGEDSFVVSKIREDCINQHYRFNYGMYISKGSREKLFSMLNRLNKLNDFRKLSTIIDYIDFSGEEAVVTIKKKHVIEQVINWVIISFFFLLGLSMIVFKDWYLNRNYLENSIVPIEILSVLIPVFALMVFIFRVVPYNYAKAVKKELSGMDH